MGDKSPETLYLFLSTYAAHLQIWLQVLPEADRPFTSDVREIWSGLDTQYERDLQAGVSRLVSDLINDTFRVDPRAPEGTVDILPQAARDGVAGSLLTMMCLRSYIAFLLSAFEGVNVTEPRRLLHEVAASARNG